MAIVMAGVLALPAVTPAAFSSAFLPPEPLQAPAVTARPMARTTAVIRLALVRISFPPVFVVRYATAWVRRWYVADTPPRVRTPSGNAWRRRARARRVATGR